MTSGDIRTARLQMPTGTPDTQQQLPTLSIARTEPATAIPQLCSLHHLHAADQDEQVEHRETTLHARWRPVRRRLPESFGPFRERPESTWAVAETKTRN